MQLKQHSNKMYDLIIIGAGITGQTAAIYAARNRMNYLLIAKDVGGQFMESGEVLNYPGIIKTNGADFLEVMEKQLQFNGVEPVLDEISSIKKLKKGFKLFGKKKQYESKTIIIATGSTPRKLNVPGEKELAKRGVTYCSICDGPLFSGMDVAIIGGGNSALEAVESMQRIAKKVYLLNITKKFIAHKYLIEKISSYKNVKVITEAKSTEILGEKLVKGIKYEKDGIAHELKVQGVIIEIGRIPKTDFVKGLVDFDSHNHIEIDCWARTSVKGIFAAGDCADGHEYQYVISAGQGCIALLKAVRYLASEV